MTVSGIVRVALIGLMASALSACGGGDDAPVDNIPDIVQEPDIEPALQPEPVPVSIPPPTSTEPVAEAEIQSAITDPLIEARPPCGGSSSCVSVGTISSHNGGPGVALYIDPERNDAVVRWGNALGEIINCADSGETITACVVAAPVEQACKDEFDRLTGLANELAAFDAVFLTAGSPCRPEEGQP